MAFAITQFLRSKALFCCIEKSKVFLVGGGKND